jgi:hypothetical protein
MKLPIKSDATPIVPATVPALACLAADKASPERPFMPLLVSLIVLIPLAILEPDLTIFPAVPPTLFPISSAVAKALSQSNDYLVFIT